MRMLLVALLAGTLALAACTSTVIQYVTPSPDPSQEVQVQVGEDAAGSPILKPLSAEVRYQPEFFDDPSLRSSIEASSAPASRVVTPCSSKQSAWTAQSSCMRGCAWRVQWCGCRLGATP